MKIEILSKKIICSNPNSIHNYFAWPTITRLPDGRLAVVASGFRLTHRCPFGKVVICCSCDEGRTWTAPAVIMDTMLDDRDGGIAVSGSDVIVTSFNNGMKIQRSWVPDDKEFGDYRTAYLDSVERDENWKRFLGSTYIISHDGGNTFGEIRHIPVSCPHGPAVMPDGSWLYVGNRFDDPEVPLEEGRELNVYKVYPDGHYEYLSEIEDIGGEYHSFEPHAIVLPSGRIIVHIRVQDMKHKVKFTIYQCESNDGGRTFTAPHQIFGDKAGAPAHLYLHDGILMSARSHRSEPYGVVVSFSRDEGRTWSEDHALVDDGACWDIGYPSTVALMDGTMLTTYYGRTAEDGPAVIWQVIWAYIE